VCVVCVFLVTLGCSDNATQLQQKRNMVFKKEVVVLFMLLIIFVPVDRKK